MTEQMYKYNDLNVCAIIGRTFSAAFYLGAFMAAAGGSVTAYKCRIVDGLLHVFHTTYPRSMCVKPNDALPLLAQGEFVTIEGANMAQLRTLLASEGISQRVA